MPDEDIEIVRRIYETWNEGTRESMDTARDLFAPDIEWSSPHPDGGSLRGWDELLRFFLDYRETLDEFRQVPDELRTLPGGRVLALFTETARGRQSGVHTFVEGGAIWTLRSGKVTRFRAFLDREEAFEAVRELAP